jgi:hypothetical protein
MENLLVDHSHYSLVPSLQRIPKLVRHCRECIYKISWRSKTSSVKLPQILDWRESSSVSMLVFDRREILTDTHIVTCTCSCWYFLWSILDWSTINFFYQLWHDVVYIMAYILGVW